MIVRYGELEDKIEAVFEKFEDYIIWESPRRLSDDAPPEAVEAFHEFKRLLDEQEREDEKWPGEII